MLGAASPMLGGWPGPCLVEYQAEFRARPSSLGNSSLAAARAEQTRWLPTEDSVNDSSRPPE